MGSYERMRREINDKLGTMVDERAGEDIDINSLEIKWGREYGVGRTTILRILQPYIKLGIVELYGDKIHITQFKRKKQDNQED